MLLPAYVRFASVVAALAALSTLAACGGDSQKGAAAVKDGTLLSPYLAIQETLANDKLEGLPELGAAILAAAGTTGEKPGIDKVVQGAGRIAAQDIATARTAFRTMSNGMIDYLKADPNKQSGLMIVHCSMTFAGSGAVWVQKEGKVMNPYEGSMMLTCGDKLKWSAAMPPTDKPGT